MRRALLVVMLALPAATFAADLSGAVVVMPRNLTAPEKKAGMMLVEEIEKRTRILLPVQPEWPQSQAAIFVGELSGLRAVAPSRAADLIAPATAPESGSGWWPMARSKCIR